MLASKQTMTDISKHMSKIFTGWTKYMINPSDDMFKNYLAECGEVVTDSGDDELIRDIAIAFLNDLDRRVIQ